MNRNSLCGRIVAVLIVVAAWASVTAHAASAVPFLSGRVVDDAEILKPDTRARLTALLKQHEEKTTNQIVVLTVPTIDGESVEEYAVKVFAQWKPGQKGRDNGVLVVVVPKDRKMRIEAGYGLEATLTDAATSRIIRNIMTPSFRDGDYDRGVEAGVASIIGQIDGTSDVARIAAAPSSSRSNGMPMRIDDPSLPPWPVRILLGAFIFGIIGLFTFIGIMTPGVGWFLYAFLIPFWAMFPIVILGVNGALILLCVYLVGYPVTKLIIARSDRYRRVKSDMLTKGSATFGGLAMSGSSSGWSSGSSSSSSSDSGFSGGGGDSGGGGSSGSW